MNQHGDEDAQEAVGDTAPGSGGAVTALTEGLVVSFCARVVLGADAGPMVEGVAQAWIAGVAHADDFSFAALFGDRGDAGMGA